MASESETPRITELHVRMDCNGCEHKIRKTLRAIDGVSDVYVDSANQKVTVVGIADPERIVKAIRKTKRVPTIFSHTDPVAPPPAEGEPAPADAPPPEEEAAAAAAAAEPAPPEAAAAADQAPPATDATVIHMVHDYPYPYSHDDHDHDHQHRGLQLREHSWPASGGYSMHAATAMAGYGGAAPYYATAAHSYSHRPSPYVSEYGYVGSPAHHEGGRYYGSHDYYYYAAAGSRGKGDGSQITSMFSDENPNACNIA
ncbi:heavy metal-associated isoprenylated plant protein 6-like [Oryza brachyantha]|uniref:heavy metal-associated isoprenylated plant protein 6-like n=1 Tax=Oryza brachyantha TaxID=4533 RepID=UPI001ADBF109|nr:heavy metal-associated isoprenylated plant protein 6-like [Oryza brachyantha]